MVVVLRYKPIFVGLVSCVGITLGVVCLISSVYMVERAPYIRGLALVVGPFFSWWYFKVLIQIVARRAEAVWITEGVLRTAHWSVPLDEIKDVALLRPRFGGLLHADLAFTLKGGQRKKLRIADLEGDASLIPSSVIEAIREYQSNGVT